MSQNGATYTITEYIAGAAKRSYAVEIDADAVGGTVDLADLAPVEDATITYGVSTASFAAHTAITSSSRC